MTSVSLYPANENMWETQELTNILLPRPWWYKAGTCLLAVDTCYRFI